MRPLAPRLSLQAEWVCSSRPFLLCIREVLKVTVSHQYSPLSLCIMCISPSYESVETWVNAQWLTNEKYTNASKWITYFLYLTAKCSRTTDSYTAIFHDKLLIKANDDAKKPHICQLKLLKCADLSKHFWTFFNYVSQKKNIYVVLNGFGCLEGNIIASWIMFSGNACFALCTGLIKLDWAKITLVEVNHGFGRVITTRAPE